jgi:succinate dehydrogenase / fumarate reductase, membrane anchor subunit
MREQVITRDVVANPKSVYGDKKAATRHFITQRVTGGSNIAFLGFLLFVVVRLAGEDRAEVVGLVGNALVGLPFAVLLAVACIHMRNGMRDILEDYVAGRTYRLLMGLNSFFCLGAALIGVAAILKLVFWG